MMRALLDTNLILDALFAREPFGEQAAAIWKAHEDERFTAYLSAITPATVFYIARKSLKRAQAVRIMGKLVSTFEISAVNRDVLRLALELEMNDFEDAIQVAGAIVDGLDLIVTRDLDDFRNSPVPVIPPAELLVRLGETS